MVKVAKKLFTVSVVALTIVWSMGLAALVPAVANAATCPDLQAGDLFKVKGNTAVYLLNADMERLYFPNSEVYHTWYADFSGVQEIDTTCVDAYPAPKSAPYGVNYRPGSRLVKVEISPSVYVVEPDNTKAKIGSEDAAKAMYGTDWAKKVRDVADVYWPNYVNLGTELASAVLHNGMLVYGTDGKTVYSVDGGKLYKVEGDIGVAKEVQTVASTLLAGYEVATQTVTAASLVEDPAQKGATTGTGTDGTVTGGDLSVGLSADTPATSNVVINIDNVVFGKFNFKAGAKDVLVNSVKIGRSGLGATGDFSSVTLYDGATKLGSTKSSWHSDGYMTYNISGGWSIPAGTSKVLTVVAKLDTASTYNALGLLEVSTNGGTVTGVPVYGNQMSGVNVSVGTVTITGTGVTTQSKNIGTNDVTLAQFKLAINSTEDATFNKITLKNKGTASDDNITNVTLYKGTTKLAGPVSMVTDKVVFVLDDPYAIEKSKNETFKVVGDIAAGVNNTVDFVLDATTDLEVKGKTYSTSLNVTSGDYNEASDSGTTATTITGAELNISLSSVAVDTMDDREDIAFGTLTLSPGSTDVKITDMNLIIDETVDTSGSSVYDIDEFEMLDTVSGAVYSGSNDSTTGDYGAGDETWSFTDEIYLEAGKTYVYTLRGDVPASVTSTASYKLSTTINTTNITAETVPDGDAISNFSVGSIVGKLVTVKAPTLTVKGITLNNATSVVNDKDVILFKGTMEASADNIHVEQVHFEENGTVLAIDNWSELGFYTLEGGEYVEQEKLTNSQMTTGTLDFDSLDFTVNNGKKVTFVVKGTLASTLTGDTTLKIDLNYVSAKDTDNDAAAAVNSTGASLATDAVNTEAGTRTLTMVTKGILYLSMLNTDTGFNKDRIVLAGSDFWAGKLKIKVDNENIKIEDLIVTSTQAAANDSVEQLCLYTALSAVADNLVGCSTVDSRGVATFSDINKVVNVGTQYWYLYVQTNPRSQAADGTADSEDKIEFYITTTSASNVVARGVTSGDLLVFAGSDGSTPAEGEIAFDLDLDNSYGEAADYQTANTKKFYVAANKISNVTFVSSYGGETVNSALSGTGEYTAAIIAITAEASANTDANGNPLKVGLANIRLDVDKFASTTFDGVTIKRIGGSVAAQSMTLSDDNVAGDGAYDLTAATTTAGYVTIAASSTLTTDSYIDAGDTAYFVVKANVNGLVSVDDGRKDWFRFDMDDLTGTYTSGVVGDDANNSIDWYDDAITAGSTVMFNALFLDTTSLTGTKVTE